MTNAKNILEIGTLGGYSTIWFAKSVPGVQVTSLEINPKHRDVAMENTADCKNVDIILGAALDILPKLAEQGKVFDFVRLNAKDRLGADSTNDLSGLHRCRLGRATRVF